MAFHRDLFWARYCSYSISMTSLNVSWYQMGVYSPMILANLTYADNDLNKITSVLNDDLKILQNWLNMNKLCLNVMKTKYMFVASTKVK